MNNPSLMDSVKKSNISREITFILKLNKYSDFSKKLKREICHKFNFINKNINDKLEVISKITTLVPVVVRADFTSPSWPIFSENISEVFESIIDKDKLRILINFEEFDSNELNELIINENEISHLIEISFIDHSSLDLNHYKSPSSTIYVDNSDSVIDIIEDIMLDISMYYTLFSHTDIKRIDFRKNFSQYKVNEIAKRGLHSNVWNSEKNNGYLSLGSYFRDRNNFNFKDYIDLWISIGKELGIYNDDIVLPDILVQLKKHKEYGELSIKSIAKIYSQLSPGEYIFIRLIKIPVRKKSQRSLMSLFGGKVLKRGKWKFILKSDLIHYKRFSNNISFFKILK